MRRGTCCRRRAPGGAATPDELHVDQDTALVLAVEALARWLTDAEVKLVLRRLMQERKQRERWRHAEAQAVGVGVQS